MKVPWNFGQELPAVVKCNRCGGRISVKGIRPETVERGEYQVSFFSCVHCGKDYQITTTDKLQRQLITECQRIPEKIRVAKERHFRPETIRQYERRRDGLVKKIQARVEDLRKIGEQILTTSGDGDHET